MRTLLTLILVGLISGCGSGQGSGGVGSPAGVLSIAPPDNTSTVNTNPPTIFVGTDCSANAAALGTWVNPGDSLDTLVFTADCKMTATKTGKVFSTILGVMSLVTSSWDAWVYDFGTDVPALYPSGGVYTTPVVHINYHFTAAGHAYIQWSGNAVQPIYVKQ